MRYFILVVCMIVVSGCGAAPRQQQSVWDMYDVRTPVPAGSGISGPGGAAYDTYIDNDSFYSPPTYESFWGD